MRRDELAIEQCEASGAQPCHKVRQCDFRRVGRSAKHRFAKEGPAEFDTIESTDQLSLLPGLNAVRMATCVKQRDRRFDLMIYPGRRTFIGPFRTQTHNFRKGEVSRRLKPPGPQCFSKRSGELEAVEWPAAGLMDTEIRCFVELEVQHGTKEVCPRVQT